MTVNYNRNLGVWQVDGRGAYATEAEARAADGSGSQTLAVDDVDFAGSFDSPSRVMGPAATNATVKTPEQAAADQREFEEANRLFAEGVRDLNGDGKVDAEDKRLSGVAYGTPVSQGGSASGYAVRQVNLGSRDAKPINGHPTRQTFRVTGLPNEGADGFSAAYSYTNTPGATGTTITGDVRRADGSAAPGTPPNRDDVVLRETNAAAATENAGAQFQNAHQQNAIENESLFTDAVKRYDELGGGDYGLSDEARAYQQEGLAQQRALLEKLLGFNEDEYADRFADQALARTIAAGRSGTSAAAQQAGVFAAMDQAPALFAEGRRQADAMANQRLSLAESAAQSFGELGTMTRGQDETRAQFESKLPVEIANSVAALTQGQMQLNQQESQMFADIWMDFARLQSVYAGMSSAEQIAWWENEAARRGQDKQFEAIKAQIKANGAVTDKDLINGIFQLGGGLLGLAGRRGAA